MDASRDVGALSGYARAVAIDDVTIRDATLGDIDLILAYLVKKSAFDRSTGAFAGELGTTPARIAATLFGDSAFARVVFGERGGQPCGFALYYFRYSSFAGRPSLWLDDLYVDAEARSLGVGARILWRLREIAVAADATHLGWTAAVQNPRGIAFYQRAGATIVARDDAQVTFWLTVRA